MGFMKHSLIVLVLLGLLAGGCVARPRVWTKAEFVRWNAEAPGAIRFVGYQGSDEVTHHFIARVMDTWTFFQIAKSELRLPDERVFSRASSAVLYYYLVDPARDFVQFEPEKK